MATTTNYYGLSKPSYNEVADIEVINANMDKIDAQMKNNSDGVNFSKKITSDFYDNSKTYSVGDYCIYDNKLYKCITAITSAESFNADNWNETTVAKELKSIGSSSGGGTGGYSHTYSTEETEVGTWVDGRPVYEQTIQITDFTLIEGFGNNYELISANGLYTSRSNNNKASIPSQWSSLLIENSTKNLKFVTSDGALNYDDFNYVTVRYIKKGV